METVLTNKVTTYEADLEPVPVAEREQEQAPASRAPDPTDLDNGVPF